MFALEHYRRRGLDMFAIRWLRDHLYAFLGVVIGATFGGLVDAPFAVIGGLLGCAIGNYFDVEER
jgi:hypothetical protein